MNQRGSGSGVCPAAEPAYKIIVPDEWPSRRSSQHVPTKRPIFLYSLLAILFAITLLYQIRYLPDFVHREARHIPFFFVESGTNRVSYATPETAGFGIHNGDQVLAVNGASYTATGLLGHAFLEARVGVPLVVAIAPKNGPAGGQRSISLPVASARFHSWDIPSDLSIEFLLPAFSLLLGFWVAFRRPRDPLAWLLLALMLSFPHILKSYVVQGWPPGWREAGMLYEPTLSAAFPIVIFLFGRFFPEPFPPGSRYNISWKAIQWLCALPFAILALAELPSTSES